MVIREVSSFQETVEAIKSSRMSNAIEKTAIHALNGKGFVGKR